VPIGICLGPSASSSVVATGFPPGPSADTDIEMTEQYHILISVKYEPDATDLQRSLAWLTPELKHTGLTLTEGDDARTWHGVIDRDTYAPFAATWALDEHHPSHRQMFDGLQWESNGSSPIVWACLDVTDLPAVERELAA
jgi:hypothetical protein